MLVEHGTRVDPACFQARIVDSLDFYDVAHLPRGLELNVRYVGSDANGHENGGIMPAIDFGAKTQCETQA